MDIMMKLFSKVISKVGVIVVILNCLNYPIIDFFIFSK